MYPFFGKVLLVRETGKGSPPGGRRVRPRCVTTVRPVAASFDFAAAPSDFDFDCDFGATERRARAEDWIGAHRGAW